MGINSGDQTTIKNSVRIKGAGLHSGTETDLELLPAPANAGIVFRSQNTDIPALIASVVETQRSTTLGQGPVRVRTVEHILSALRGLGVDNAVVLLNSGEELPALDGSAWPYVQAIEQAGLAHLDGCERPILKYNGPESFVFRCGLSSYKVLPAPSLSLSVSISFPGTPIGIEDFGFELNDSYAQEISRARTFCLESEVKALREAGLAKGGTLINTIVVGPDSIQSQEPLRYPNEFVRHKILDLLGDLSLIGLGAYSFSVFAFAPSHTSNWRFAQNLKKRLTIKERVANK